MATRSFRAAAGCEGRSIEKEPELGGLPARRLHPDGLVQTAFAMKEAGETFGKLGVQVGEPQLDFGTANQWKDQVVKQMTSGVAGLFKANGVEWVKGTGRFKDANTISVEGGEDVTFKQAIIATGSFRCGRRSKGSTRRAASTRPGCSHRRRCRAASSSSAAASSAASSRPSSAASAPR